jgi:transposase
LPSDKLLTLDECSFHLNEDPRRGYSLKGMRAISQKPSFKGEYYTLLLCIRNLKQGEIIHYKLIKGGADTKAFYDFLVAMVLTMEGKHYLMLDNNTRHHAKNKCKELGLIPIRDLLVSKNIEPTHLPPYTPELNPTELCFNFLRQQIKKSRPRSYEELKNYVDKAIVALNEKDLRKYFEHCFDYFKDKNVSMKTDISF